MKKSKSPENMQTTYALEMNVNSLELNLDSISEADLLRAAEATVDAALCCHGLRFNISFSPRSRAKLISELHEDPARLAALFDPANFVE